MNEIEVTIVGNLADDPELRFTPSGVAVCKFRIAQTPRVKKNDEWVDGEPIWLTVTAWRELGEHIAETLKRGSRAIVKGRLSSRTYQTDAGENRTVFEVEADAVGPELRYATAEVKKVAKSGGGQGAGDAWGGASRERPATPASAETQRTQQAATAAAGGGSEPPPW